MQWVLLSDSWDCLARRGCNAQLPRLSGSHHSVALAYRTCSVPQEAVRLSKDAAHSPTKFTQSTAASGPSPFSKKSLAQVQPAAPRENSIAAHCASCKRTSFSIAIHILSTIQKERKHTPGACCATFCETQPEKYAHIRRIFSVAHFSLSAYSRERCRGIDNEAFAFLMTT